MIADVDVRERQPSIGRPDEAVEPGGSFWCRRHVHQRLERIAQIVVLRVSREADNLVDGLRCARRLVNLKRLPNGFCPPKNTRANDSVTIATRGEVAVSRSSKSRPARSGVPIVGK